VTADAPPPLLLASHSQATVRVLAELLPDRAAGVMARLPAEVRDGLAAAARTDLVPVEWDVALVRAMVRELGDLEMRRVARETMLDGLRGTRLGGLLSAALKLFGASPAALLGWGGKAWAHVTRRCGTLRLVSSSEGEAELALEGAPAEVAGSVDYLAAIGATIEAVLVVCGVEGAVTARGAPGGGRFAVRWRPP
jgi:hypothetical protein